MGDVFNKLNFKGGLKSCTLGFISDNNKTSSVSVLHRNTEMRILFDSAVDIERRLMAVIFLLLHCMPTLLIANCFKIHLYLFEIGVGGMVVLK